MTWKYFKLEEFACSHCGKNEMQLDFIDKLDRLRGIYGRPLVVNSGYRCPEHNSAVSSTGPTGPTNTGRAVDFGISGVDAYELLEVALSMSAFTGVGVNQKGNHAGRFLHIDDLPSPSRPGVWSY